jgi:hypothetical protein
MASTLSPHLQIAALITLQNPSRKESGFAKKRNVLPDNMPPPMM